MIDTDKYEGLIDTEGYIDYDGLDHLLAEVKRLREENEMLREELKNDDTGIKAIDGLLKAVGDRNEEVKRLREQLAKANKYVHSICQHSDSMLMDYEDYMKGDD